MNYAFIVNPASGNGKGATRVREELKAYETDNLRIYCTEGEQDATVLADSIAAAAEKEGETVNVFACGGDGTIQEIAKGLFIQILAGASCRWEAETITFGASTIRSIS